jgi:acyl-CoA synthetase (AMP-forming)/AMP-acid ligase II
MQPAEVRHVVKDSGAVKVIDHAEDLALGEPMEPTSLPDPGQIAALFYTSGTTGSPKGVELTHKALVGQNSTAVLWPAHMRRDEVLLALPVAHIMGFISVVGLSLAGVQTVFFERFRANRVMDAIEHRRCSGFVGVPAMYRMMVEAGAAERDLSSVRIWMSGADVMPADLARQFKRFGASATVPLVGPIGEATFVEGYGMVEVGGGIAAKVSPPMVPLGVGDTVGFKLPGYHFKVVDTDGDEVMLGGLGELLVRGPGVLKGYWNAPDATDAALTPDGWLRTGDLVRVGPFGTVLFRGRTKQVIKSGGYSVYPLEVEATLETHPEVVEASVVGMEDPKLGEVPIAAVRLVPSSTCTGEEIGRWAAEELAHYKVPRRVVILDDFPRTGTQKVQKDRLKEIMSAR